MFCWRAWQESNLRPAASKAAPPTVPACPGTSLSLSLRGVTRTLQDGEGHTGRAGTPTFATPVPRLSPDASPLLREKRKEGKEGLRLLPARPVRFLSPRQVAEQLGVCRETIYRLLARGELAATRVGSALRIASDDLEAYLRRRP